MATYKSSYTGPQIDRAVSHAVNMDVNPTAGHTDRVVSSGGVKSALNTVDESIAIRVSGNKTTYASGAAIGQYVIVDGSTITGITDGIYKAAKAIPYNTVIDSTYLTAVSGGGLNDLKSALDSGPTPVAVTPTAGTNFSIMWNESVQIGKLVVVSLRVKATAAVDSSNNILTGFPLPKWSTGRGNNWICVLNNNKGRTIAITDLGYVRGDETWATDDNAVITGTYCAQ